MILQFTASPLLLTNRQPLLGRNLHQSSHSSAKYNPKKEAQPTEIGLNRALCWDTRRKPITGSSQLECRGFPHSQSPAAFKYALTTNPEHKLSNLILLKGPFCFVKRSILLLKQDKQIFFCLFISLNSRHSCLPPTTKLPNVGSNHPRSSTV